MRRKKVWAIAATVMIVFAATGASAQKANGSAPNGKPFVALQTQIDTLADQVQQIQADAAARDAAIAELDARWRDAEARLDDQAGSLQALFDADLALQELIAELRQYGEEFQTQLDALQLEVSEKQAAIIQSCPAGSSIQQVSGTGTVVCEVDDVGTGGAAPLVLTDFSNPTNLVVAAGGNRSAFMSCPSGYRPISGGYIKGGALQVMVNVPESNGWRVGVANPTATDSFVRVVVRCVAP